MSDQKIKGYNEFFIATNSIASENRDVYGIYEWSTQTFGNLVGSRAIQDASITNAKIGTAAIGTANIGTLTFNQISGGTANFGGSANGDGVINVLDASGTQVGKWDKDGIEVKTTAGTTIIDGGGIVSVNNFSNNSYFGTNTVSGTNSFSFTDISGSNLSFYLDRDAVVLISFFANVRSYAIDNFRSYHINVGVNINGTAPSNFATFEIVQTTANMGSCLSFSKQYQVSAGTNTIKLQWSAFSDDLSEMTSRGLQYCILGK